MNTIASTDFTRLLAESVRSEKNAILRDIAAREGLLPLHADIGGVVVLDRNGEILSKGWEDTGFKVERMRNLRLASLVEGAQKYPELRALLPDKPSTARECPECDGTGRLAMAKELGLLCGRCGGLGWLDEVTAS